MTQQFLGKVKPCIHQVLKRYLRMLFRGGVGVAFAACSPVR